MTVIHVLSWLKMWVRGHCHCHDDHTPAHRALSQVAAARTGHRFGPGWRRQPGRPRHSWIQQIGDGTPFSIRAEWSKARRRGHSGLTQRTSAVYAIWWWLWWCHCHLKVIENGTIWKPGCGFLPSKNGLTYKSGFGIVQGHRKCCRSVDHVWFSIDRRL